MSRLFSRGLGLRLAKALGAAIASLAAVVGVVNYEGNIHDVEREQVYRSGQLSGTQLHQLVKVQGIKSILNLRGPNLNRPGICGGSNL